MNLWQKNFFLLNFRGAALSTLQPAQTERVWRRQGLILNIEHHFPHMQQWADQEVTLGLTERLRQHVAHRPQPRSAFQQSDQRFMAKLSSVHLNCKSTAKKKSHGPGCILNQRRARRGGEKSKRGGWRLDSNFTSNIYKVNVCLWDAQTRWANGMLLQKITRCQTLLSSLLRF